MFRLCYSRFIGADDPDKRYPSLNAAKIALRDEVRALREAGGPYAAPWRQVSLMEAFPGTTIEEKNRRFEPYTHVSWDPRKPEMLWIERVD